CQHATDGLAANISGYLAQRQQEFSAQVESIVDGQEPAGIASRFDEELRRRWDLAEVGFCVTLSGKILSPSPDGRSEARMFYYDNSGFLGNREAVEVYPNALNAGSQYAYGRGGSANADSFQSQSQKETPDAAPSASAAASTMKKLDVPPGALRPPTSQNLASSLPNSGNQAQNSL